jgi:hypothetical protein
MSHIKILAVTANFNHAIFFDFFAETLFAGNRYGKFFEINKI